MQIGAEPLRGSDPGQPIRVGCCGWPVARTRYTEVFDLVEIQHTFYRLPSLTTVHRWRAGVPSDFEFTLKAPQLITHEPTSPTYRRLGRVLTEAERPRYGGFKPTREVAAAWDAARAIAAALRARLVVFQCPASFGPTEEHIANLRRFFREIERADLRLVWEPRGSWPREVIRSLCQELDLIHCVDPFLQPPLWGEPAYFRLHGRGGYHYRYSDSELDELRQLVEPYRSAYVLFNNTAMFEDARRFLERCGERGE